LCPFRGSVDKVKAEPTDATRAKSHEKKIAAFDEQLKAKIRDLGVAKVPSNFVVMLSVLGLFAILSNKYARRYFPLVHARAIRNICKIFIQFLFEPFFSVSHIHGTVIIV
jgi:hypothetical protein